MSGGWNQILCILDESLETQCCFLLTLFRSQLYTSGLHIGYKMNRELRIAGYSKRLDYKRHSWIDLHNEPELLTIPIR